MRRVRRSLLALILVLASVAGWAQGRNVGFDWPASGSDPQRRAWLPLDPNISVENLSKGFEFLWREKLENAPRQAASLNQGVTMNGLIGFTPVSFVTGVSNNVFAVDNDTGFPVWHRRLDGQLPAPTARCPGGVTGAAGRGVSLVRDKLELPAPPPPRSGYRGGMGLPGEGVPMEIARRDGGAGLRGLSPIPAARGGGGGVQAGRYPGPVYVISSAGTLYTLGQSSGVDVERPVPFLPPNARYSDLTAIDGMLYTSTSNECGGAPNGVWAIGLDPQKKTISSWRTNGGSPVGNLSFTAGGRVLVAVGPGTPAAGGYANAIVALDPKTLQPADWFTNSSVEFVTTPVVIGVAGREIVAIGTRDGRVFLLDAASLGGANHATPLFSSEPIAGGVVDSLAAFEQPAGTPWLLVPTARNITALRIVQNGGKVALQPGWTSREIAAPTSPIVVHDVVFAAASGRPQGAAVLYAFDSRTGRELWTSGKTITSHVPPGNIWSSNSQVHVGAHDGTVYAFGYVLERR